MNNEKDNKNKNKQVIWKFCKINYTKEIKKQKQKIKLIKQTEIALQIGDSFYLRDLRKIKKNKDNTRDIKILEKYNYIPADASEKQIMYYVEHQRKRQLQLNI